MLESFADRASGNAAANLVEIFESQVQQAPDAIAVKFQGEALTYGQLDAASNRLAHHLIKLGVGPEVLVALCLERSLDMVMAILAILKAGGAYVPLDPAGPSERIQFMRADSGSLFILSTCVTANKLVQSDSSQMICLDDSDVQRDINANSPKSPTDQDRAGPLSAQNLAYLIYTSGSTGIPKGVAITHHNVMRLLSVTQRHFQFGPGDKWTLFHSYAFDFSVWEIWGALLHGGTLVIVDDETRHSPWEFLDLLAREQITVLNQTPSAFYALMQADKDRESAALALRFLIFGGEGLNFARLQPWYERHSEDSPRLVNMYGITETTVHVTFMPLTAAIASSTKGSVIGHGLSEWPVHLLNSSLEPVADGEVGELYVAGSGLARGYFNRPGLTAERFIASPFGPPGARMYRSGDLARRLTNGYLEYFGRADQQVKIRGFRIELGEIDAAILSLRGVAQSAVVPREVEGDTKLVGYIVLKPGFGWYKQSELRAVLSNRLPEYMIPSAFVLLDALPLNVNGKLDRTALPPPRLEVEGAYQEPGNETERRLCDLFKEITGAVRVGVRDNFFDIGGNSLLGVMLIAQIEKAFSKKLKLATLFEGPTAGQLAQNLIQGEPERDWRSLVPLYTGKSATPIFMVQWLERDLARYLGKNRPVWGVSLGLSRPFTAGNEIPKTIEETAAHYISELRLVRPNGPYMLLGHSAGGVVAFEMARQLSAEGERVSFLGLVDSVFPRPSHERKQYSKARQLKNLITMGPSVLLQKYRKFREKKSFQNFTGNAISVEGSSMSPEYRNVDLPKMLERYDPKPLTGKVTLFLAQTPLQSIWFVPPLSPQKDWSRVATEGVDTRYLPGDHMQIVKDPLAAVTAESIEAALAAVN
jgi:nonribosomal peptide synthetase DhbF